MDPARMEVCMTDEEDAVIWAEYGLEEHEPRRYFRVSGYGVFERWSSRTRSWVHVTSERGRDYLMRRTIMGDGTVRATAEQWQG